MTDGLNPRTVALTVRLSGPGYVLRHHSPNGRVMNAVVMRTKRQMVRMGLAAWVDFPTHLQLTEFGEQVKRELLEIHKKISEPIQKGKR